MAPLMEDCILLGSQHQEGNIYSVAVSQLCCVVSPSPAPVGNGHGYYPIAVGKTADNIEQNPRYNEAAGMWSFSQSPVQCFPSCLCHLCMSAVALFKLRFMRL